MSIKEFEIRSNINSSFAVIERLTKEREEREKAEREEKWKRDQEERERAAKEWQETHPNIFKYTYASYYNRENFNYDYGAYCKIHFYEWSNVESQPIVFERYTRLYKFLDDCGLFIKEDDNNKIKPIASCYIACKPGSKDLIVCTTYDELKKKVEEARTLANVIASVPDV
jgi:hypothetical protein